jgi:hypothetical protein
VNKATRPPWIQQPPPPPDLICAHCESAADVAVLKDAGLDAAQWHLWCAQCGHEWTVLKPPSG